MKHKRKRTDIMNATVKILEELKNGQPYTLNKLSEKTKLNFRTVKKSLALLELYQKELENKRLDVSYLDKMASIRIKEKIGMTSLPEKIQNLILKTAHYPIPNRDEEILTFLYLHKAIDEQSAIKMSEHNKLRELVEAEHVVEKKGRFYLSKMGKTIVKGAMKLYPELGKMHQLIDR
ncbi:MAG: hypothetical protein ACREA5_01925 [Nitrosotalea sp.]